MLHILWIWLAFVVYFANVFFSSFINKVWKIIFSLLFFCSSKAVEEARQEEERIETYSDFLSLLTLAHTQMHHNSVGKVEPTFNYQGKIVVLMI